MKLTNGKKAINIQMMVWDSITDSGYSPDWSSDFFEAGSLPYNADTDTYTVSDINYCIEQANDWKNGVGDFYYDDNEDISGREVFVEEF